MRISRGRAAAIVAAVVVVVVAAIVLVGRGGEEERRTVELSSFGPYPARGSLIDDRKLREGAADAWRDEAQGEDENQRPGSSIDVLYAGRVSGEEVATGPDRDLRHDIVVLQSRSAVATLIRPKGGEWKLQNTTRANTWAMDGVPVLDVGSGLFLVAADRFGETAQAVALPRQLRADEEVQDDASVPESYTVDLSDPLWSPKPHGGPLALRLPGEKDGTYIGQVWLSLASPADVDVPLVTRTAGGQGADDRLWKQLVSPASAAGTTTAFVTAVEALRLDSDDQNFDAAVPGGFSITSLGTAALRGTPAGDQTAQGLALGYGTEGDADVVTVGLTGKDLKGAVRTKGVVLGRQPPGMLDSRPLGASWITPDETGPYYLVYAVDPALDRIDLRVGAEKVATTGSLGF